MELSHRTQQTSLNFLIDPRSQSRTEKRKMRKKRKKSGIILKIAPSSSLNDENQNHHPNKSDAHEFAQIIGNPAAASEC